METPSAVKKQEAGNLSKKIDAPQEKKGSFSLGGEDPNSAAGVD